ncbi:MAG: prepilin-type N-terminal cleavage/methylation domain-containing protein [Patescibacteria group bacterium]|nr:prepilin-type N-terminal cleavage/methylation domain-containing protein [Patescibacteria group bacterium]
MKNKKRKFLTKSQGVTLIELLISIAIVGTLLTVLTSLYVMGIRLYQKEFRETNIQSENRILLDRIIKDAKEAIGVELSYDSYVSDTTSTIILKVPAIDADKNIIYDAEGNFAIDRIIYEKLGNNLNRIVIANALSQRPNANLNISDKITGINFTYTPNIENSVELEVNLITQDTSSSKILTVNNTSKVLLRNK